ncbi:MAG: DUF4870 domain-containing protein [Leeuwenhoekiella sp.]
MIRYEDRSVLIVAHLSQLLDLITGIGGFIIPLILWLTQRDKIMNMDSQGKGILNFQISLFIYGIICIPLLLFFGLGVIGFILIGIIGLIFPIINAIKASNGEKPFYPFSMEIIK